MARKFFVGGNFKMNGSSEGIKKIIDELNSAELPKDVEVAIAPPFPYLGLAHSLVKQPTVAIAAQNVYLKPNGAYTGEVSASILADVGVTNVILGHSERRALLNETSEFVADKVRYTIDNKLNVILCVGESRAERDANRTLDVIRAQLEPVVAVTKPEDWQHIVVAYEPVWAIGTGLTATPEDAQDVHEQLRAYLAEKVSKEVAESTRIIYGGSVSGATAPDLSKKADIDGFLVGGASLKPEFADIIKTGAARS